MIDNEKDNLKENKDPENNTKNKNIFSKILTKIFSGIIIVMIALVIILPIEMMITDMIQDHKKMEKQLENCYKLHEAIEDGTFVPKKIYFNYIGYDVDTGYTISTSIEIDDVSILQNFEELYISRAIDNTLLVYDVKIDFVEEYPYDFAEFP